MLYANRSGETTPPPPPDSNIMFNTVTYSNRFSYTHDELILSQFYYENSIPIEIPSFYVGVLFIQSIKINVRPRIRAISLSTYSYNYDEIFKAHFNFSEFA